MQANPDKYDFRCIQDTEDIKKFITKTLKDKETKLSYGKFYVDVLCFIYKLKDPRDAKGEEDHSIPTTKNRKFQVAAINHESEGVFLVVEIVEKTISNPFNEITSDMVRPQFKLDSSSKSKKKKRKKSHTSDEEEEE